MKQQFQGFAEWASKILGSSWMFIVVIIIIIVWAASGLVIKSSDSWQLILNTIANTFELVILVLIQNTENRGQQAMLTKQDEILLALSKMGKANPAVMQAEDKPEEEIEGMKQDVRQAAGQEGEHGR